MHLHEYQAKELLLRYGIKVAPFAVASSPREVEEAIVRLKLKSGVVKAQVHAGGRRKAGGVLFGKSEEELLRDAKKLLGGRLVTPQTTEAGLPIHQVLLMPFIDIREEYYLGIIIDRSKGQPLLIASREGGVEIEEVALKSEGALLKLPLPIDGKLHHFQLVQIAKFMGWKENLWEEGMMLIRQFVKAAFESDALLLEINPLVETADSQLLAIDAKCTIDDNAAFRERALFSHFDRTQLDKNEALAMAWGISYVSFDGDIGCLVNGAGLAMAVIDLVKDLGGKPANFLDIGGIASEESLARGFEIIFSDKKVKVVFVNILGEIVSAKMLSEAILKASEVVDLKTPLVVRLFGEEKSQGRALLEKSKLKCYLVESLEEGVRKAIEVARGNTH